MRKTPKIYKGIPNNYPLCMHAECPKASTCLHQSAFQRHGELETYLKLLNPSQCTKQDKCPHYIDNKPVLFAKGFTNFQTHMLPKQYDKFMNLLIFHFGRNLYFRCRRGDTLLTPEEQEVVREALRRSGVELHLEFDSYIESIHWIP